MNEWVLFLYPFVLIACLVLAARWQPKGSPTPVEEREPGVRPGYRSHRARHDPR